MYDQTSAGREREMDVGTSYDSTSHPTSAPGTGPTGTGIPEPDYQNPSVAGTEYPRPDYVATGYRSTEGDIGSRTVETNTQNAEFRQTGQDSAMTEKAASAARTGTQAASTAARETAQTAKEEARNIAGEVSAQARNVAEDLRQQITDRAHRQQGTMVTKLRQASDEMREMARGREQSPATSLVGNLAERTNRFADHLESRGFEGVLSDVQEFARRRPGTFLLASAAAGFLVGRLGKSVFTASGVETSRSEYEAAYRAGAADTTAGLRAPDASTGAYTHRRDSLIHDEGGWTDLRSDPTMAPSTTSRGEEAQ